MNQSENIKALRDALAEIAMCTYDGTVCAHKAQEALRNHIALTADASEDAPDSVLMPREATEEMMHAAEDVPAPRPYGAVYRAMVAARPAPVAATPAPDVMRAISEAHDLAMKQAVQARIPECGDFGAIAQNLSFALAQWTAAPAAPIAEVTGEPVSANVSEMSVQPLCNSGPVAHAKLAEGASEQTLFENTMRRNGMSEFDLRTDDDGSYRGFNAARLWEGWQARGQQAGAVDRRQAKQPVEIERRSGFEWRETNGGQ